MKNIRQRISSFLAAAALVVMPQLEVWVAASAVGMAAVGFGSGCSTTSARATYKTLAITGATVSNATDAWIAFEWNERARLRAVPGSEAELARLAENDRKVERLFDQFRIAYLAAVSAAELGSEGATPENVAALAAQIITAVSTFAQ